MNRTNRAKVKISTENRMAAWLCTLVYFASYVMRINIAVMMVKICGEMQLQKSELSVVVVALTVCYAVGQVISGFLGDHIRPTRLLFFGLLTAVACNVTIFFCHSVPLMAVIWGINGLAHALLWPPMVRLLAQKLDDVSYNYAVVRVSSGSSFATVLMYLVCPLLLQWMNWRFVMLGCAGVGVLVALLWRIGYPKLFANETVGTAVAVNNDLSGEAAPTKVKMPAALYFPLVLIFLDILCMGVLREGVTNWMPSYMKDCFHLSDEGSILLTVIPAIFAVFSYQLFAKIQQKLVKNEMLCTALIFALASASALILYFVTGGSSVASTILMSVIIGCMHGAGLMLTSVVPKRFVQYGVVSTISGLINSFTYVGASLSTYGFAVLAEQFGWKFTIGMWFVVALVGMLIGLFTARLWKKYCKN